MIRDGQWELFSHDPHMGRTVWRWFDGSKTHFRIDQRTDEIVKANKAEMAQSRSDWRGDWHKVASVPLNILYASGLDDAIGQKDDKFLSRWLNDSDHRAFRTKGGNV